MRNKDILTEGSRTQVARNPFKNGNVYISWYYNSPNFKALFSEMSMTIERWNVGLLSKLLLVWPGFCWKEHIRLPKLTSPNDFGVGTKCQKLRFSKGEGFFNRLMYLFPESYTPFQSINSKRRNNSVARPEHSMDKWEFQRQHNLLTVSRKTQVDSNMPKTAN